MDDEKYIRLCIDLAKNGAGFVSPNPLVGCVIVKDDRIIGQGYHKKYGDNHAEVNAIYSAKESLTDAVLYVNLEPCVHFGKTPPCVDKIIESGIKKVVIGTIDPNPLVAGKGIKKLSKSNVKVKFGVLEKECLELNKFFFKYIKTNIPYVNLKIAQSLDGYITSNANKSEIITSKESRKVVHKLRSEYDAVLIGVNTAIIDNPSLNVRLVEGRDPYRVVLDSNLRIRKNSNLVQNNKDCKTIIFCSYDALNSKKRYINYLQSKGVRIIPVRKNTKGLSLKEVLRKLGSLKIASLLVEGGSKIFSSFLQQNLWDEINIFLAPKILGDGLRSFSSVSKNKLINSISSCDVKFEKYENDIRIIFIKSKK
ncbi:MAG: bifunctional diaminohydroxyphosphoribosylaminopyrimidine deaminase/5-amino-6-(5-phosphoribosylamino)uracil reductase RibD [Ignavibacterium sp.]|nr:bifunctional diaminohydroxyphosphoribosylaminopyrimidine deaminase/5-amino-6-(5-phosphoribosylamino)uracil reductase RibD [Ignavibacterium sp.]MDW8375427.1 bifunctional diaminohydroxyphosphoribosylaminopyrimidine deaminase/5-amino-6-(5-phosphoribosylamino)uracil reductase RibD [Ignavibacteriales bacterium]